MRIDAARLARWMQAAGLTMVLVAGGTLVFAVPGSAASAGPQASANPNSNLQDKQFIAVQGSGFDPYTEIQIMECEGSAASPPKDSTICDGRTLDTQAFSDRNGNFINAPGDANGDSGYEVFVVPGDFGSSAGATCDDSHQCVLFVGEDHTNWSAPHTWVDFSFAAGGSNPTTTTVSNPTTTTEATTSTTEGSTSTTVGATSTTEGTTSTTSTSTSTTSTSTTSTSTTEATTSTTSPFTEASTSTTTSAGLTPPPAPSGVVSSVTAVSPSSDGHATAQDDQISVDGGGAGALTLGVYGADPVGAPSFSAANSYFDLRLAAGSSFSGVGISDCNLDGATGLHWWNPQGSAGSTTTTSTTSSTSTSTSSTSTSTTSSTSTTVPSSTTSTTVQTSAGAWQEVVSSVPPVSITTAGQTCLTVVLAASGSSPTTGQLAGTVFAAGSPSATTTTTVAATSSGKSSGSVGGASTLADSSSGSSSGGTLPFTGPPTRALTLAIAGLLTIGIGEVVRRRALALSPARTSSPL